MNRYGHWKGQDAFRLFEQASSKDRLREQKPSPEFPIDASHAFYLGYELARAEIALHLGKQYTQDEPLQWGLLGATRDSSTAALHANDRDETF